MSSPCRREFLASSIVIGASDGFGEPLAVAGEAPDIWGRTILAQPFDKGPFREVKVPAWVQETTGVGYTLSGMNSAERKAAAEMGVTISEMGFVDPFYAYYDSKLLKRRSPHVPLDRLEKDIAEYQKLGIRVLGVYPPTLQGEVYELHPDWRRVATDTDQVPQVDLKKYPHGGMLCLLGPYGDFFIDVLAEIVTKFPAVSAFSFDGLHHAGGCYCKHCRATTSRHRHIDPETQHGGRGFPQIPTLGRSQARRRDPPHADPSENDQPGRGARNVDHERRGASATCSTSHETCPPA